MGAAQTAPGSVPARAKTALKIMRPNPAPLFLRLRGAGSKNWFAGNADDARHTCAARYTLHFQELPRGPFPEPRADINRDSSRKRYCSSEPRRSLVSPTSISLSARLIFSFFLLVRDERLFLFPVSFFISIRDRICAGGCHLQRPLSHFSSRVRGGPYY